MKVGVYVGSFDPVHKGHESIVKYLLTAYLDKIILVPTNSYWDKQDLININFRIDMLKLVFKDKVIIDSSLSKYLYTYQIMEKLRKIYDNLYLIIGADNIVNFDKWKNVNIILKSHVIVLNRNGIDISKYVNSFIEKGMFVIFNEFPYLDISSTYIRDMIRENKFNKIKDCLSVDVLKYIRENNLYLGDDTYV